MEVLKSFLLFGVIEIFILIMFYKYIGGFNRVKYWHFIIICPFYLFVGLIHQLFVKQVILFILFFMFLSIVNKNKKITTNLKYVLLSFVFMLCSEAIICLFIDIFTDLNINSTNILEKFTCLIPMRVFEITIIIVYKHIKRW